ncbi:MAG: class I SAM-dependent methyltransferase [Magnetococcus sp. DMHC-6]
MLTYYPPRYLFRRFEILRRVRTGERFLEIGAGNLKLAVELLAYFKRGVAVEFSPRASQRYHASSIDIQNRLELKIGDFYSFEFHDRFDCVVSCEVMEHLEEDGLFLSKIYALLQDGGEIIVSVPARTLYWSIHDEIVGHRRRYEKQDLIQLFTQAGFVQIQVISYGFPFVNILRFPRRLLAWVQYNKKVVWDHQKQTIESGLHQIPDFFKWFGLLINPFTFAPLNWIAAFFNRFFYSDGCIVVAYKPRYGNENGGKDKTLGEESSPRV